MRMCLFQNRDEMSEDCCQGLLADATGVPVADAVGRGGWRHAVKVPSQRQSPGRAPNLRTFRQRPVATSLLMIAICLVGLTGLQFLPLRPCEVELPPPPGADYAGRQSDVMTTSVTARWKSSRPDARPEGDVVHLLRRLFAHPP